MLQIISGRFFGDGKVHEQESDAILYSNYSWLAPIKTSVAELRPVDTMGRRVSSYVLRYTNRYERASPKDPMVLAISDEAVEQFRLLASFYFHSFFHVMELGLDFLTWPDCRSCTNEFPRLSHAGQMVFAGLEALGSALAKVQFGFEEPERCGVENVVE
jgi:hypothetical protein